MSAYRLPATEIESVVVDEIVAFLREPARLTAALDIDSKMPHEIAQAIAAAVDLAVDLQSGGPSRQRELIEEIVEQVMLHDSRMRIELKRTALEQKLLGESDGSPEPIVIGAAIEIVHRGVETRLVV